jgi:hypothetical protein
MRRLVVAVGRRSGPEPIPVDLSVDAYGFWPSLNTVGLRFPCHRASIWPCRIPGTAIFHSFLAGVQQWHG